MIAGLPTNVFHLGVHAWKQQVLMIIQNKLLKQQKGISQYWRTNRPILRDITVFFVHPLHQQENMITRMNSMTKPQAPSSGGI